MANSFSLYFEGEIDCSSTVGYHNKDAKENSLLLNVDIEVGNSSRYRSPPSEEEIDPI